MSLERRHEFKARGDGKKGKRKWKSALGGARAVGIKEKEGEPLSGLGWRYEGRRSTAAPYRPRNACCDCQSRGLD